MSLKWAISPEQETVAVLVTDPTTPDEVTAFVRALREANAMGYRKVLDITLMARTWTGGDLQTLAWAFEKAAGQGPRGPVAIVARSHVAQELAAEYAAISKPTRPFAVFAESDEARRWLDSLMEPKG